MARLDVNTARCAALFASGLQRSDDVTAGAVRQAISGAVRRLGVAGCVGVVAGEFGDHPEAARDRMRWARHLVTEQFGPPGQEAVAAFGCVRQAALAARVSSVG